MTAENASPLLAVASVAAVVLLSYLLGSFPTSIVVGKIAKGIDLRRHGSGNAGATNAFRVLGPAAGSLVVAVDLGKAVVSVLIVARLAAPGVLSAEAMSLVAGCAAVVGHIWTVFAGFRGGKGVGPAAGMVLALYPLPFLATLAVFAGAVMLTGIVSVGSLAVALFFPLLINLLHATGAVHYSLFLRIVSIAVGLLIVFTHRTNITRLLRREENRFPKLMLLRGATARSRAGKPETGDE